MTLFSEDIYSRKLERLMTTVPNFKPRGVGFRFAEPQIFIAVTATPAEILSATVQQIRCPPFRKRFYEFIESEENPMIYLNERHRARFALAAKNVRRDNYALLAALYLLTVDGCIPARDEDDPKYARLGRELIQSGNGIFTEHGMLFVDENTPFQRLYDGQNFPAYFYDPDVLRVAKAEYDGKSEYLYFPGEEEAIVKAFARLGTTADEVKIALEDFNTDSPEWFRRFREIAAEEGVYVSLERLKGKCVKEVKRLNGNFTFRDANDWQKG